MVYTKQFIKEFVTVIVCLLALPLQEGREIGVRARVSERVKEKQPLAIGLPFLLISKQNC